MNIEIKKQPVWECSACNYQELSDKPSWSYPVKCTNCGEEKTHSYYGPPKNYPHVRTLVGNYDLCSNKKEFQYMFYNVPTERRGFVIGADYHFDVDGMSALEIAEKLKGIIDKYLYSGDKPHIEILVTYLKEHETENNIKEKEFVIARAEYDIWKLANNIEIAKSILGYLKEELQEQQP